VRRDDEEHDQGGGDEIADSSGGEDAHAHHQIGVDLPGAQAQERAPEDGEAAERDRGQGDGHRDAFLDRPEEPQAFPRDLGQGQEAHEADESQPQGGEPVTAHRLERRVQPERGPALVSLLCRQQHG